ASADDSSESLYDFLLALEKCRLNLAHREPSWRTFPRLPEFPLRFNCKNSDRARDFVTGVVRKQTCGPLDAQAGLFRDLPHQCLFGGFPGMGQPTGKRQPSPVAAIDNEESIGISNYCQRSSKGTKNWKAGVGRQSHPGDDCEKIALPTQVNSEWQTTA